MDEEPTKLRNIYAKTWMHTIHRNDSRNLFFFINVQRTVTLHCFRPVIGRLQNKKNNNDKKKKKTKGK